METQQEIINDTNHINNILEGINYSNLSAQYEKDSLIAFLQLSQSV